MTSSKEIAQDLSQVCINLKGGPWHRNAHLVGNRAVAAATYPPKLVTGILRALKRQMKLDGRSGAEDLLAFAAGPLPDTEVPQDLQDWDYNENKKHWDDVNGGYLSEECCPSVSQA